MCGASPSCLALSSVLLVLKYSLTDDNMPLRVILALAALVGVNGSPAGTVTSEMVSLMNESNCIPGMANRTYRIPIQVHDGIEGDVMATGELNPNHFPAQRAAKVVQHYLNAHKGSPFRLFRLHSVESGKAENLNNTGRKYQLELTVEEIIKNTTLNCSAGVTFPHGEGQQPAEVHVFCEELSKSNVTAEEEAFYQEYKTNQSLVSVQNLPDSYGHIEPDMKPLWHLGIVASSFVMFDESTENTLYNMAQVANITQLANETESLKFDSHILLHEMVSQEILHWKLLFTWSPAEGVEVLQKEQLRHCHK